MIKHLMQITCFRLYWYWRCKLYKQQWNCPRWR